MNVNIPGSFSIVLSGTHGPLWDQPRAHPNIWGTMHLALRFRDYQRSWGTERFVTILASLTDVFEAPFSWPCTLTKTDREETDDFLAYFRFPTARHFEAAHAALLAALCKERP